jgi:hypothetical protein
MFSPQERWATSMSHPSPAPDYVIEIKFHTSAAKWSGGPFLHPAPICKAQAINAGKNAEKQHHSPLLMEKQIGSHSGKDQSGSYKTKHELSCDPEITLSGIYPREIKFMFIQNLEDECSQQLYS